MDYKVAVAPDIGLFGRKVAEAQAKITSYTLTSYKKAIDDKGAEVTVEDKKEMVTRAGLNAQIIVAQKAVEVLQEKLDALPKED